MADYDLFVIGAGSGGVRAARVAAAHGARVAIAEEHKVGGTCVIRGCVPKKLLVYGAHFAEDLDDAAMFGWDVPQKRFNWPVLRDNVLAEVARLEDAYTNTLKSHDVTILHERAEIAGPNSVHLASGKTVTRSAPTKSFTSKRCPSGSSSPAAAISPTNSPAFSTSSEARSP
jgi:glutathione reductase (NADPH)